MERRSACAGSLAGGWALSGTPEKSRPIDDRAALPPACAGAATFEESRCIETATGDVDAIGAPLCVFMIRPGEERTARTAQSNDRDDGPAAGRPFEAIRNSSQFERALGDDWS